MNIVEKSKDTMLQLGAAPIMYLMIALSVISVAIIIERVWFFAAHSEKLEPFAKALSALLGRGDLGGARRLVNESRSVEAAIVAAGLQQFDRGPEAASEAMAGATAVQRMRLERRLSFLGTLGNNAPFVGLLGTVIGIVQAFDKLQLAGASNGAGGEVMGAIAEALVATAIGLAVAIPAVAAFNAFQRQIKSTLSNSEALTHILLAHLKGGRGADETPSTPFNEPVSERGSVAPKSSRGFARSTVGI
jgi:biopolymer transport protein ExbB